MVKGTRMDKNEFRATAIRLTLAKIGNDTSADAISTTRALMVSLMKKRFYQTLGKREGQKRVTIKLQNRGIQYLSENGLLAVV